MAVSFTRLSCWLLGGKDHHDAPSSALNSGSSPSDYASGFREHDTLKFPASSAGMRSSSRRVRRKWQSREERRVDKEYDIVIVPSDGGCCLSGSESDDSDWSIGWLEPHAPDFDSETEGSFAVLVPCYGRGRCEQREAPKDHVLGAVENNILGAVAFHDGFSTEGKTYIEQWLSSLQNM